MCGRLISFPASCLCSALCPPFPREFSSALGARVCVCAARVGRKERSRQSCGGSFCRTGFLLQSSKLEFIVPNWDISATTAGDWWGLEPNLGQNYSKSLSRCLYLTQPFPGVICSSAQQREGKTDKIPRLWPLCCFLEVGPIGMGSFVRSFPCLLPLTHSIRRVSKVREPHSFLGNSCF